MYTKGPWEAVSDDVLIYIRPKGDEDLENTIALIMKCGVQDKNNAHLLAAAPELLEALEELYELIAEIGRVPDEKYGQITNAASVIAKARGS